jgi:ADP-heptose:LPS heptosyltransferase
LSASVGNPFEPDFLARLPEPPHKVVVLRTNRIGDFILSTPALRALRVALPEAHFTFIGLPFLRNLVARSPHLDRFVEFPGFPGMAEQFFDARVALRFFGAMQDERFDIAIQLNGSGVYSNPFALMLGARWTVGWVRASAQLTSGEGAGLLDAALPAPETGHEIDRVLTLPLFLGAAEQGKAVEFPLRGEDRAAVDELLAAGPVPLASNLIGVHPGAREMTKRWASERFAAAAMEVQRRHGGVIVIVGGPDERELGAEVLAALLANRCEALNLTGRTTLPMLGALIERMAVLLTNDSGPAHIAYALGTPTVTVFGGTDPSRWGPPLDERFIALTNPVHCWPCPHWVCPTDRECLAGITVDTVVEAAGRVLTRHKAHKRTAA